MRVTGQCVRVLALARPSEVDKRASSYLQQMQERRAKPKLQGWQRLRGEKPSERPRRARSMPKRCRSQWF